jgi:hypothetical protein
VLSCQENQHMAAPCASVAAGQCCRCVTVQ